MHTQCHENLDLDYQVRGDNPDHSCASCLEQPAEHHTPVAPLCHCSHTHNMVSLPNARPLGVWRARGVHLWLVAARSNAGGKHAPYQFDKKKRPLRHSAMKTVIIEAIFHFTVLHCSSHHLPETRMFDAQAQFTHTTHTTQTSARQTTRYMESPSLPLVVDSCRHE